MIWGRRRLGKTTLLKEICDTHESIYYLATRTSRASQLRRISRVLGEHFDDPIPQHTPLASWGDAFIYLNRQLTQRTVVVIDEFPYIAEADAGALSEFQAGWDEHLGANAHAVLVLNGSSLSMMEQHVLGSRSPLYGRRTGQWKLDPIPLSVFREFFPGLSFPKLIETYTVVGGVPYYALQFDRAGTLESNVKRHILAKGTVLYGEVPFLLREEVSEPRSYFPILAAVATGAGKFGEISSKTGLDKANLGKYLSVLQDLGLVCREVPITEAIPSKSRKGLYSIEDPFTDFWFRYVWPYLDELEMERVDRVWKQRIAPDLGGYVSKRCERWIRALLESPGVAERLGFRPTAIGKYWDRSVELDMVGLHRESHRSVVAEVKWTRRQVGLGVAEDLRERAQRAASLHGFRKQYVLFSRSGFTKSLSDAVPEDMLLVDLREHPEPA